MLENDVQAVADLETVRRQLEEQIGKVVIGQRDIVEGLLVALLAGGHCLLVGVPGLAKTLLIRTLAQALDLSFGRIQFTPDLMPSDITGTEVLEEDQETGHKDSEKDDCRQSETCSPLHRGIRERPAHIGWSSAIPRLDRGLGCCFRSVSCISNTVGQMSSCCTMRSQVLPCFRPGPATISGMRMTAS